MTPCGRTILDPEANNEQTWYWATGQCYISKFKFLRQVVLEKQIFKNIFLCVSMVLTKDALRRAYFEPRDLVKDHQAMQHTRFQAYEASGLKEEDLLIFVSGFLWFKPRKPKGGAILEPEIFI